MRRLLRSSSRGRLAIIATSVLAALVASALAADTQNVDGRPLPWSLKPVVRPDVPRDGSRGTVASNPIDALIGSQLANKHLTFAPEADRRTLIRRIYLVMHGLPPTPAEVERFLADDSPNALENLVDRVLANPRYGERWARHWLDIVRFAESNGFETNRERKNAYPYRDYVIQSLNEDKPYDQFVREQIAGDALGVDAGTGFLVAGAYDLVKSPDINLTLMQRQDELADIVNTTGTTFLGLTLGCARCHDHKFDPISQKDYYAIQAVFAGVNFAERTLRRPREPREETELAQLQAELASSEAALAELRRKGEAARPASESLKTLRAPVSPRSNEEKFAAIGTTAVRFTILATNSGEPCIDELEVFDEAGKNVALATTGAKASASGTLPGFTIHKVEHLNDGQHGNSRSWISDTPGRGWVQIDFPESHRIDRIVWGRDREEQFRDRIATDYRIEVLEMPGHWKEVASSRDRETSGGGKPIDFRQYLSSADAAVATNLQERIRTNRARAARITNGLTAWLGTFSQPETIHRLHRGDPLQKREVVAPDALSVLGTLGLALEEPEQRRRVRLAEWIASPQNPLTARVMVNRLWHYVFGHGLVDTPSDFGANGATPTHPALLDWLADEFVQHGWSIKHMQRLILLSRTFRQFSAPRADGLAADADARLLWRFPPRRLEAEAIRDGLLATSGALDSRMGGMGHWSDRRELVGAPPSGQSRPKYPGSVPASSRHPSAERSHRLCFSNYRWGPARRHNRWNIGAKPA